MKSTTEIIKVIKECCIEISHLIRNGDSDNMASKVNGTNETGDEVKKLDVISNEILKEKLLMCSEVRLIGSEEESTLISSKHYGGKYLVCYDPLDGSSNIDVNITIGTIFGIFKIDQERRIVNGRNIVAAGYCLYGSSTQFVVAQAEPKSVKMYHLYEDFVLVNPTLKIPKCGPIYAVNESNKHKFLTPSINVAIEEFITQGKTTRWVGSLVADAHRTLIKGGFFCYPSIHGHCNGKLRLLYEVYPFAFIFEMAGGNAIDTTETAILDLPFPENPHQKVPVILCGPNEYQTYMRSSLPNN